MTKKIIMCVDTRVAIGFQACNHYVKLRRTNVLNTEECITDTTSFYRYIQSHTENNKVASDKTSERKQKVRRNEQKKKMHATFLASKP